MRDTARGGRYVGFLDSADLVAFIVAAHARAAPIPEEAELAAASPGSAEGDAHVCLPREVVAFIYHKRITRMPFVCLFECLFVCLFACLFACLFVCLFVRSYVCMFVCLFVCLHLAAV